MDIFGILELIGGLALFLYGMNVLGAALEKQAGGRFKGVLERITANPLSGVLLGCGITAIIQSSSATTVMVVGFVNSGIMTLQNSVGVIMGANVGTAATAWILSLAGIESSNVFVSLLKPANFSPVLAVVGVFLLMGTKDERKKDYGQILLGFAVLMFGMTTMSDAVKPLAASETFRNLLLIFKNPVLGVLTGALITAIIQSSSASVGILQAMSMTGSISFATAIPIVMGQNIGTCVTALISCAGTNANAKRAAFVHLYFNVIGVVVLLTLYYALNAVIGFGFTDLPVGALEIAVIHTVFKIMNTAMFLPFTKQLVRLAELTVKGDEDDQKFQLLDDRFLTTPGFAVARCRELTVSMSKISRETFFDSIELLRSYDESAAKKIIDAEDEVDKYEDKLGTYMVKLSGKSMAMSDSREVSRLLHCIGDFERISDHAVNIMHTALEMRQKDVVFSEAATRDLGVMCEAVKEIVTMSFEAFAKNSVALADMVEPLEQVIDLLKSQLKARHISRLQRGECTTLLGFIFSDIITNFERVADHCSNIAVCIVQISRESFETHEYLNTLRNSDDTRYKALYAGYLAKYSLPPN